jgi:DNA (cytosine-5)-methyltransferase 1
MLNVLDLFAGIGGFTLGLERTGGFRTVAFCEIDKKAQLVLKKHWPDTPIFEDVSALNKDLIDATIGVPVDVITGGFPCQDISLAGKGAGLAGERSGLWFQFHRLIKEIQPRYALIENVSALRSRGLDAVLSGLAEIGYDAEWHCIPAAAVGAPHRRDRIWIIAYPSVSGGDHAQADAQRADADCLGSHRTAVNVEGSAEPRDEQVGVAGSLGEVLANAEFAGRQGRLYRWADSQRESLLGHLGRCRSAHGQPIENWWSAEPDVGRVADGVSGRVDRLKQLGNAVVPQIPQLLGEAILRNMEKENGRHQAS